METANKTKSKYIITLSIWNKDGQRVNSYFTNDEQLDIRLCILENIVTERNNRIEYEVSKSKGSLRLRKNGSIYKDNTGQAVRTEKTTFSDKRNSMKFWKQKEFWSQYELAITQEKGA